MVPLLEIALLPTFDFKVGKQEKLVDKSFSLINELSLSLNANPH